MHEFMKHTIIRLVKAGLSVRRTVFSQGTNTANDWLWLKYIELKLEKILFCLSENQNNWKTLNVK